MHCSSILAWHLLLDQPHSCNATLSSRTCMWTAVSAALTSPSPSPSQPLSAAGCTALPSVCTPNRAQGRRDEAARSLGSRSAVAATAAPRLQSQPGRRRHSHTRDRHNACDPDDKFPEGGSERALHLGRRHAAVYERDTRCLALVDQACKFALRHFDVVQFSPPDACLATCHNQHPPCCSSP